MNGEVSREAAEFGAVVADGLAAVGGIQVLQSAVADPGVRLRAAGIFEEVGVWELDPYADQIQFEAAAVACRSAGEVAFPYPIAERLAGGHEGALALAVSGRCLIPHLDLDLGWRGVDLRGRHHRIRALSDRPIGSRLAPFGVEALAEPDGSTDPREAAMAIVLHAWWLLGLVDRALGDAVRYASEREQFGRPLVGFQAVAFRIADGALAVRGLEEFAKYTLWAVAREVDDRRRMIDALALRVATQDAVDTVLRHALQIHGAMGLTDEVSVSWLARAAQTVRRLPMDKHRSADLLVEVMGRDGLEDFGQPGRRGLVVDPASIDGPVVP